ncbi:MAG: hypothetical protein WCG74_12530 [Sediminibacterium sp.]
MKKWFFLFFIIVLATNIKAQDKIVKFGIGPSISVPTGIFQLGHGIGLGLEITSTYPISETINVIGQLGYHSFSGKEFLGDKPPAASFIPIIAGIRYSSKGLLVGIGIGYGMYNFGDGDTESGFTFRPQIGYDLGKIEILGGYTSTSTSSFNVNYFGITTAYKF